MLGLLVLEFAQKLEPEASLFVVGLHYVRSTASRASGGWAGHMSPMDDSLSRWRTYVAYLRREVEVERERELFILLVYRGTQYMYFRRARTSRLAASCMHDAPVASRCTSTSSIHLLWPSAAGGR